MYNSGFGCRWGPLCLQVISDVWSCTSSIDWHYSPLLIHRSQSFRPTYARVGDIRAFIPLGTPVLAITATVTKKCNLMCAMNWVQVCLGFYRTGKHLLQGSSALKYWQQYHVDELRRNKLQMPHAIICCWSLKFNVCADMYAFFLSCLGEESY